LAALTVVACLVRIIAGALADGGLTAGYHGDERDYATLATHLALGQGFTDSHGILSSYRTPGLPVLLAPLVATFGPSIVLMRLFMCVAGSLIVPACYLLAESATGSRRIGWTAAIIAVWFPAWVVSSSAIESDVSAAILVTLLAWVCLEGHRRESLSWFVGAGVIWGCAVLARAVALAYAPGIFVWLLLVVPSWKRRVAVVAAVMVPAACVLGPWSIRNMRVHGTFVGISTQGGTELYISNNPSATGILAVDYARFAEIVQREYPGGAWDEASRSRVFKAAALEFIRENPFRFVQLCVIRFLQFWKVYSPRVPLSHSVVVIATFGVALPFFLIEILRGGWRSPAGMLLLLLISCHTAVHVVFTSIVRYRIPIEPLVIVLALAGFCWCYHYAAAFTDTGSRGRRLLWER
jgi:4-amino-4-deoxy-L-arabinose transferase-like glycosyltransferase